MLPAFRPTPTCTRFQTSIEMPCIKCGTQMRLALRAAGTKLRFADLPMHPLQLRREFLEGDVDRDRSNSASPARTIRFCTRRVAAFVLPADLLSALFVPRLFLPAFIANDALIIAIRRGGLRLWHALLAAMFAALILRTFQIIFPGHCDHFHFPTSVVELV